MTLQDTFIRNLKFYRKQRRMTQNELTLRIDMGLNYINGVEQGAFFPKPEVIDRIAGVLGVQAGLLFMEPPPVPPLGDAFVERVADAVQERLAATIRRDVEETLRQVIAEQRW